MRSRTVRPQTRTHRAAANAYRAPTSTLRRQPKGKSGFLFGMLSIAAFVFFWMFILIAMNVAVASVSSGNTAGMRSAGAIGLFSFLFPLAGIVLGIIGLMRRIARTTPIIGLVLNGLLLLWVLYGMVAAQR